MNQVINPFLDNKETVGKKMNDGLSKAHSDKVLRNRIRANKIATHKRNNEQLRVTVDTFLRNNQSVIDHNAMEILGKFKRDIGRCSTHTLIRKHANTFEFIGAHTCKHKLCNVCNYQRSKRLRRKYTRFFNSTFEHVDTDTGEITERPVLNRERLNFMHLTLTVPHVDGKWLNKDFYVKELMQRFNQMRKEAWWKRMVYAGEFGLEITRRDNGLHIHIHSLLVVHKGEQNRNLLHREIMLTWNRLTKDSANTRKAFTDEEIESIKKGNKLITDVDIKLISPKGATLIGLENLYKLSKAKISKYDRWDSHNKAWKHYIDVKDNNDFMQGLMECIKYHFEPLCMNKDTGEIDLDLLVDILPKVAGQPLYRKFGAFHGVKALNINNDDIESTEEIVGEVGGEVRHPDTGQPVHRSEYEYVVVNAQHLFFIEKEGYKPVISANAKVIRLENADTLLQAMFAMVNMSVSDSIRQSMKFNPN